MVEAEFEWDDAKNAENLRKHGITFEQAKAIFLDPLAITIEDPNHSDDENRFVTIGMTFWSDTLTVVHVDREHRIRIISARPASRAERRKYMNDKIDRIHDKPTSTDDATDDMLPEYDFSNGVRGKYWQGPGRSMVVHMRIDEDVRRYFPSADEVNTALRQLIAEGRAPKPRNE